MQRLRKRWWLMVLPVAILAFTAGSILVAADGRSAIEKKFDRITTGMTKDQVSEIIGQDPDPETLHKIAPLGLPGVEPPSADSCWTIDNEAVVMCQFDRKNRIMEKALTSLVYRRSMIDRIRDWLGLW